MHTLPPRIAIAGPTSSGKTTLGRRLAAITGAPHIELDALYHGPNWTPRPDFRERVEAATRGEAWITDGNYSATRDVTWARADMVIWLDYSLARILPRLIRRTMMRWWRREVLWNGNRESLRTHFMTRDSLFLWAVTSQRRHRRTYPAYFDASGVRFERLRSPRQLERWLAAQTP